MPDAFGVDLIAARQLTQSMRILPVLCLIAGLMLSGCAHRKTAASKPAPGSRPASAPKSSGGLIVTPADVLTGKVVRYNEAGRFVVLSFPIGHLPAVDQRLFVFRKGLKVGELKVTGPQRDDHIVADVTAGEAQAGDEARDK